MSTVAIPLLLTDPAALAGLAVAFPDEAGIGDLPWYLHELSDDAELELFGEAEQPLAVWFQTARTPTDEDIRRYAIPLLGTIHLLGRGIAGVAQAWVYPVTDKAPTTRPLALQLLGQAEEFFLPAGLDVVALERYVNGSVKQFRSPLGCKSPWNTSC